MRYFEKGKLETDALGASRAIGVPGYRFEQEDAGYSSDYYVNWIQYIRCYIEQSNKSKIEFIDFMRVKHCRTLKIEYWWLRMY